MIDLRNRHVLVVDDEFSIAQMTECNLEDCEATVTIATNIDAALVTVGITDFDLAILDINLGHGDTSEPIAVELKRKGVPFFFITGYTHLPDGFAAAAPILTKPYKNLALEAMITLILAPEPIV